ncbi:MAG TPA: ATP-dependent helicase, partial [Candidatus Binatia bacterium]|nr:ATP-dependent helicase [Candidatus Binatia bacterium]
AFLQRLGRTGRRPGTRRNCLFLATSNDALIRAAGLIQLWSEGFVEPVVAPPEPFHILAQQIMALTLQQGGLERARWREWVGGMPAFAAMAEPDIDAVIDYMLSRGILFEDGGLLSLGTEGERSFGYKNFLELFSVFTSPPLVTVLHGRSELGQVHESSFHIRGEETPILLLAGRSWKVSHVDWGRRVAHVEPAGEGGRSRWMGTGQPLSFALCQAMRRVLETGTCPGERSLRARRRLEEVAADFPWLEGDSTVLVRHPSGEVRWWTFAGFRANRALGEGLAHLAARPPRSDNLWLGLRKDAEVHDVKDVVGVGRGAGADAIKVPVDAIALDGLKFVACLPAALAERMMARRLQDAAAVAWVLDHPLRSVTEAGRDDGRESHG